MAGNDKHAEVADWVNRHRSANLPRLQTKNKTWRRAYTEDVATIILDYVKYHGLVKVPKQEAACTEEKSGE